MTAIPEELQVTYEQLADLEKDFEDVETEIIRQQVQMTRDLYAKREKLIAQIPVFWSLVFEQAPPDIDEFIQPTDSNVLLTSLKSLSVSRFEIEGEGGIKGGDPRSVAIRFEFEDNDYFEDKVLEKKFWYRRDEDGWAGLVSEPVEIKWCEGKDLTEGLLGMAKKVWDQQQATAAKNGADKDKKKKPRTEKDFTPEEKALKEKLDGTGIGGMSFFAWFGYCGPRITAEESRIATEKERENRRLRAEGKKVEPKGEDEEEEDEDEDDDEVTEEELEIFPEGDSLAIAISEDLWPSALKYFTQAQEDDMMSDVDFESDEEGMDIASNDASENEEGDEDAPAPKKRKA